MRKFYILFCSICCLVLMLGATPANAMYFSRVHASNPHISVADDYQQRTIYSVDNYGNDIMFMAYGNYLKLTNKNGRQDYLSFIPPDTGHGVAFSIVDIYTQNPTKHFWSISAWTAIDEYVSSPYITLAYWLIGQDNQGNYVTYVSTNNLANMGVYLPSRYGINETMNNEHNALQISLVDSPKRPSHPLYARWDNNAQWISLSQE